MIIVALRNIISVVCLIAMLPFLILASFFIVLEDGFPVFFNQERLGLNQKIFSIYKLRTLKNRAPQVGTHELDESFKLKAGKVIRALKIDEFPQLLNVIKGELNLVGPRPGLNSQIELKQNRELLGIFQATPGITGLSQILGYDMSNPEKLAEVDKIYIQNHTARLDLLILLGTFFGAPRNYLAWKFDIPNLQETR
jgi:O-antigen biosynthesis protein WbqP